MSRTNTNEPRVVPVNEIGNEADDVITVGPIDVLSPSTRAEIDIQITTAKRYPRSIKAFKEQALAMATLDEETASGCFYCLPPRGGKSIEGPSARLAEIVLSSWGNIRADSRVIDVGARELTAEGVCWDLERNVALRVQTKRRITDRKGNRYNDDMIVVTGNAACAIALRNVVFKVIPMAFTRPIYHAAREVAIGNAQTLASKRITMVEYFGKMGVRPEQVLAAIERPSVEDITLDDLIKLKGLATAIKDGDTTVDDAFPEIKPEKAAPSPEEVRAARAAKEAEKSGDGKPVTTVAADVDAANAKVEELRAKAKKYDAEQAAKKVGKKATAEMSGDEFLASMNGGDQ